MNRQQRYLLGMLKEIDAICKEHGITYYIGMGTLIGAIRHEGFLPWDDDADILMTRAEFERFKKACEASLPENRHLGSVDMQESYGHIVPRYVSTDTTAIHTCQALSDDVAGEVIDIFLLDPIADGQEAFDAYVRDLYLYSLVINCANVAGARAEIDPELFREHMNLVHECGQLHVVDLLEKRLASHFDDNASRYAFRWQGVQVCFDRMWFEDTIPLRFEDTVLQAPKGANEFLTFFYGEGWEDIPEQIKPAKHNTASSLEFAYTEALESFHPTHSRETLRAESEKRRYLVLKNAPVNNALRDERARAKTQVMISDLTRHLDCNRAAFKQALEHRDGKTLASLLGSYIAWQTDSEMVGRHLNAGMYRLMHPILADVSDQVFEGALYALLSTGRVHRAARLVELRRAAALPLTAAMEQVDAAVEAYRASTNSYYQKAYAQSLETIRPWLQLFPEAELFYRIACRSMGKLWEESESDADAAAFADAFDRGIALFPAEGFYVKLKADWLDAHGESAQARELYLQAAENTRDGLALLDIAKKIGYHPSWLRKPAWAKEAGVAQWPTPGNEAPQVERGPQENAARRAAIAPEEDPRLGYLFKLVCELASTCTDNGIDYVLGPRMTAALFKHGRLPDSIDDYAIVCRAEDIESLLAILQTRDARTKKARAVEYMGNSTSMKGRAIRYHGLDSLHASLKKNDIDAFDSLYASAIPLETATYPQGLERVLQQWDKCTTARFAPSGRRARLYAKLHRISNDTLQAGDQLFKIALGTSRKNAGTAIRQKNAALTFDSHFIAQTQTLAFGDDALCVPVDLDTYLGAFSVQKPDYALKAAAATIDSVFVDPNTLFSDGFLAADYFERKRAAARADAPAKALAARFNQNFSQIKETVRKKEASRKSHR